MVSEPAALSLYVVSDELYETLRKAQVELEDAVEGRDTHDALQRCATHLHEVRGVLQMVEIYGAALLAEEMEAVCSYLTGFEAGTRGQEDGLDALTRSMVQMPAYLDRMLAGGRDIALVLLPMLNDLRAVRGMPLLSESTLLLLNVRPGRDLGALPSHQASGEDVVALARKLRPAFQLALLGWIQGQNTPEHLSKLARVAESLERAAVPDELFRLWWVVGGVLEALREGGIETSVSIKRLLGQADREIRRLIEQGVDAYVATPPVDLLNNLLYYVARATSTGQRVSAIRQAFNLSELLPGDRQVEEAREGLAAPGARLMQTVAAAIREDLARVKDVLDIYVRTGSDNVADLAPQLSMLKKISDTLGVLGLGDLRGDIQREIERLRAIVEDNQSVDDATLIQIAATLLRVEDNLDSQLANLVKPREIDEDDSDTAQLQGLDEREQVDYQQVTHAVVRECLINLARLKEAISRVAANNNDRIGIDNAGTLVRGVTAGLLMLNKDRAKDAAERILAFVERALKRGTQPLSAANLDRLADAIVSLEYYLETIQVGRRDPWYMLDNAESCLDVLESLDIAAMEGEGAQAAETMQLSPEDVAAALKAVGGVDIQETEVLGAPEVEERTRIISIPVVAADAEHLDPELLELFIEESKEEIETIRRYLPKWIDDPDDTEALITIRRSFHTLKGSGRMVGAERIGEYCWSIEDLLNRLINRTLTRTPPMLEFIREAADALPSLVEQIEVGVEPEQDIAFLISRAAAFAEGDPNAATMSAERRAAAAGEVEETALEMDPVLLDIFSKETAGHLQVIKDYVAACDDHEPPYPVSDNLHRACHTLHGSVNMANVDRGIEITAALNRMVRRHLDNEVDLSTDAARLLSASVDAIETIVAEINSPDGDRADFSGLVEQMNALTDAVTLARYELPVVEGYDEEAALDFELPVDEQAVLQEAATSATEARTEFGAACEAVEADTEPEQFEPAETAGGDDVYDAEIAAIFTEEASEILDATDSSLLKWTSGGRDADSLAELKRHLHTLKGGARMAGVSSMGNLSHELETVLIAIDGGRVEPSSELDALLQRSVDELHRMRDGVVAGHRVQSATALEASLQAIASGAGATAAEPAADEIFEAEPSAEPEPWPAAEPLAEMPAELLVGRAARIPGVESSEEPVELSAAELPHEQTSGEQESMPELAGEPPVEEIAAAGDAAEESAQAATSEAEAAEALLAEANGEDAMIVDLDDDSDVALDEDLFAVEVDEELDFGTPPEGLEGREASAPAIESEPEEEFDQEPTIVAATSSLVAAESNDELDSLMDAGAEGLSIRGEEPAEADRAAAADAEEPEPVAHWESEAEPEPTEPAPLPPQRDHRVPGTRRLSLAERQEFARIDAELLEDLLNAAGEISIYHSRLTQQVSTIDFNLQELEQTVSRLRSQLRKLEIETETQILTRHQDDVRDPSFDPLELDRYSTIQQLSRALAESANDVASIKDLLQNLTGEAETLLVQQARVTAELQDGLMRTRMVPFQRHVPRLTRLVRQVANECGKQAELQVEGASGELDRQVLEKMLAPFEHMVRNAVIHGIEPVAERQQKHKPLSGRITIRLHREGSEMVIDVSDDGVGLNVDAIRRNAYEQGLLSPDSRASDEEVMELILTPGFSTAGELTQSAGRGVGMDVVANEVKKLGGSLRITSIPGQGTNFAIRLPFTLAITQALIVRTGEEIYALPLPSVDGVARVPRARLDSLLQSDDAVFEYGEQYYRLRHLGLAVGGSMTRLPDDDSAIPLILVRSGDHASALLTDEMLSSREVVVKSVGPQLAGVRGIAGATILGDGRVVLILDVGALVRAEGPLVEIREGPPPTVEQRPLILVVDDSITVRRVTERFLQRQGLRVETAKDGIDAIEKLQEARPDVILLDIEMPRMDGYEFASHVRNDERFADTPIIMITSRVSEKHKARAIEIGVNDYLGKPYQDHQLLEAINRFLPDVDEADR